MTRRDAPPPGVWYPCPRTGKRGYLDRADARAARARTKGSRGGDKDGALSIYRCRDDEGGPGCGRFHIGHLPRAVVKGEAQRADVYVKPRDTPGKTEP